MKILNKNIIQDIEGHKPIKIHIGSGGKNHKDYYNLDVCALDNIDIVADLNQSLDMLPDNSVSAVYSRHTFEHIQNFSDLMAELHRICTSNAIIEIIVPHFSNPYYYSDPTHVRFFGLYTMHYFTENSKQPGSRKLPTFYTNSRYIINKTYIDFYKTSIFDRLLVPIIKPLLNISFTTQEIYERRWTWIFPAWEIKYSITPYKPQDPQL